MASTKDDRYDLIVIGGGAAGLTASGLGATVGARTLLVERARPGGDCTWTGCIPSKTLLKAAKVAQHIRGAGRYGLTDQSLTVDFGGVMKHVRRTRERVYEEADKPENLEALGITVRQGTARFIDPHHLEIEGPAGAGRVEGRFFIIATGGRPRVPAIDGLDDVPYLTSENLFELEEQPRRLAVVGGGPIGTEMAQAFNRLGTEVTVIDQAPGILGKDDPELAEMLQATLAEEGVRFVLEAAVDRVARTADGITLSLTRNGEPHTVEADALLLAVGRVPRFETLNLEAAGVPFTEQGITVDDRCRTGRKHIFAAGDVTGRYQFTHMSEHMAKVAATNALLRWPMRIDQDHVPWVTYTDPELAHIGATEAALREAGTNYEVYRFPFGKIDRAVTEGEETGLIKVYAKKWNGKILGASLLGASAGDMVGEFATAMRNGLTLRQISDTIHPYPTYSLGVRRAADQWYVRNYAPTFVRILQKVFRYRGPVLPRDPERIL